MLWLWDRGFFSYELWQQIPALGEGCAVQEDLHRSTSRDRLLEDLPEPYDRGKPRVGIVARVIRYTLDDSQRVGDGAEHVLITNLLDEEVYPAEELIILYHERWEEEQVFDEQKTHQDPRRATKPAQVRSETPAGVIQEISALSPGHFVIRSLML